MQLSSNFTISQFLNYNNFYKTSFQVSKCFFRFKALKDAFENCSCLGPQRNPISALSDSCPYVKDFVLKGCMVWYPLCKEHIFLISVALAWVNVSDCVLCVCIESIVFTG